MLNYPSSELFKAEIELTDINKKCSALNGRGNSPPVRVLLLTVAHEGSSAEQFPLDE